MGVTTDAWPAGATWVFQGTVAEDATVGTHVSSLTVTPGSGQEMQILYGGFVAGAGAANLLTIVIDDGTNIITRFANATSLASGADLWFPSAVAGSSGSQAEFLPPNIIVSGTMRYKMSVSTATVSLTHTFSLAARLKTSALPTATLADTVGTPTLVTNTNRVF